MNVSEETNEFVDSDISDNDDLIADPDSPTRPKWAAKTIHAAGELVGNPSDPRRTRSQFESALCMKYPLFKGVFSLKKSTRQQQKLESPLHLLHL